MNQTLESSSRSTHHVLLVILCAMVGIIMLPVAYIPGIIVKAYLSDLLGVDLFYGLAFGVDGRMLLCLFAPIGTGVLSALGGHMTLSRTRGKSLSWLLAILVAIVIGFLYGVMPCGLFYFAAA